MPNLSLQTKCIIFCYHTGTLFLIDSMLSTFKSRLSFSVHTVSKQIVLFISGLITEHHNIACRLIMKAISKGSVAGFLVHMDAMNAQH